MCSFLHNVSFSGVETFGNVKNDLDAVNVHSQISGEGVPEIGSRARLSLLEIFIQWRIAKLSDHGERAGVLRASREVAHGSSMQLVKVRSRGSGERGTLKRVL